MRAKFGKEKEQLLEDAKNAMKDFEKRMENIKEQHKSVLDQTQTSHKIEIQET